MQRSSVVLLAFVALVFSVPLSADAEILYDSAPLSINRWRVHLSRHAFEAESGQTGFLEIRKNTPERPIHLGYLLLNRRLIPLRRFFNGPDLTFRETIKLRRHNRLRIFLIGTHRASVSMDIGSATTDPPPSVEFSGTPETIEAGSTSTLSWSSQHADSCTIEPDIGSVEPAGSVVVSPATDATYTITAMGPGGTVSASVRVAVVPPAPTVEISLSPDTIGPDEVSTLSWSSTHSDTCVIEPDIGSVEPAGGISTVAPWESTTYTITATGPGGTATAQASLTLDFPPPIAELNAAPDTIVAGESTTLQWRGFFAFAGVIEPGIGEVGNFGSVTVSPADTTTYTLTVQGPGGTASTSVTVTVKAPPPQVTLTANPMEIAYGESATLTWTSASADQVSIDQGIGNVAPSGTITVHPPAGTTYTITATGPGGSATSSAAVAVKSPIDIEIRSPSDGETIQRPDVMVQGTFLNATGKETGIVVNGKVAMVYGNRFVVNHVPLQEGGNTLTVTATDVDGNTRTAETTVNTAIPEHYITLTSTIESGSAPLDMTLAIDGTFGIQDALISCAGLEPDQLIELAPEEYQATLIEPGITFFTAEVMYSAATYRDTIGIVAADKTAVDALLQEKWSDMKTHLAVKDVAGTVRNFDENKKGLYEEVFSALLDRLPQIVDNMQDISLISIEDRSAKYRIRRVETHNTGTFEVTYYVYFIKDENGIWRIYRF